MKERDFQTTFNHYLKAVYKKTGAFELKQTKSQSIAFNSVVPHQVQALLHAKNSVLVYKIPDMGYQNPFDVFCLTNVDAFVVIKYPDFFCLIDINDWVQEVKISTRKSLTADRAKEIATIVV
jgi:penicillin-binding protein-related factor A (putative recombinase)